MYVHLGLNWQPDDGLFRERLGLATTLTLVRGVMANLLLAHLLSGVVPLPSFTLGVLLIGIATDSADGQIARRTQWQTRLGGYLDSEADLYLSSAISLCAWQAGVLPGWVAAIMLFRFAIPLLAAVLSYFVAIRQVDLTHTILGRSAGIAQAALLITVLAPPPLAQVLAPLYLPLLSAYPCLLGAYPTYRDQKQSQPVARRQIKRTNTLTASASLAKRRKNGRVVLKMVMELSPISIYRSSSASNPRTRPRKLITRFIASSVPAT